MFVINKLRTVLQWLEDNRIPLLTYNVQPHQTADSKVHLAGTIGYFFKIEECVATTTTMMMIVTNLYLSSVTFLLEFKQLELPTR